MILPGCQEGEGEKTDKRLNFSYASNFCKPIAAPTHATLLGLTSIQSHLIKLNHKVPYTRNPSDAIFELCIE